MTVHSSFLSHMGGCRARRTVSANVLFSGLDAHIHFSGVYDQSYLDYLRAVLSLLPEYGLSAFVALHQDVWSRYSGGSGAPAWTLEAVGFKLDAGVMEETQAAWLKGVKGGGHVADERGLWPCGYQKLIASTMAYVHPSFCCRNPA